MVDARCKVFFLPFPLFFIVYCIVHVNDAAKHEQNADKVHWYTVYLVHDETKKTYNGIVIPDNDFLS